MIDSKITGSFSMLDFCWDQYCGYAAAAREQKASQKKWQMIVLYLTIFGAAFGVLSQNLAGYEILSKVIGIVSGITIGLSAYFSKEFIKSEKVRLGVQARSAAEAFKAEAYLYATGTYPYNTPNASKDLKKRVEELEKKITGFTPKHLSDSKKKSKPPHPMPIKDYIKNRVKEQIRNYYIPMANRNERYADRWNRVRWVLGVAAVVLGVFSGAGFSGYIGGWVAVIGAAITAVAAHLSAGRYNYLVLSYRATAQRLKIILSEWGDKIINDQELVRKCEDTISIENKVWLAEWSKEKELPEEEEL